VATGRGAADRSKVGFIAWRRSPGLSKVPGALNATLSSVIACPNCNGPLSQVDGALLCAACQTRYAVRDGVPRFSDGSQVEDERLKAEWQAQGNSVGHYSNPVVIMNRWEEEQVMPHILGQLDDVAGPVLDAGCGVGHLGQSLERMGRRDIELVGKDFQGQLLAQVTVGYVGLAEADVHHLPFRSAAFSAVLTSNALHHFPDPYRAMAEIARVLKPGGVFICYDPRYVTPLEMVKKFLRRNDKLFTKDHKAFRIDEYRDLLGSSGLSVSYVRTVDTIGPLMATALDYLKVGRLGFAPQIAKGLASIDRFIEGSRQEIPSGLMLVGRAVKPL